MVMEPYLPNQNQTVKKIVLEIKSCAMLLVLLLPLLVLF